MRAISTVRDLTEFGRTRLSTNFFMRDFLYSEVAAIHGLANIPADPQRAIAVGKKLCEELLEPLQQVFGRIAIRSAYRSAEVNSLGNRMMRDGKRDYNCASNEANAAGHIWDLLDNDGCMGATACIVAPWFWDRFREPGDWQKLAWWIHDNLPYSDLCFYKTYWAFNITWHESPKRVISSYVAPLGCLTKPGKPNHTGSHEEIWAPIAAALDEQRGG
jgi:hypothetical protein